MEGYIDIEAALADAIGSNASAPPLPETYTSNLPWALFTRTGGDLASRIYTTHQVSVDVYDSTWASAQAAAALLGALLCNLEGDEIGYGEDADRIEREKVRNAELEAKRAETERLKAEGITVENKNTSKKNKKAVAAQKEVERKAAEARAERARKREAMGIVDDIPASQVGARRYARGRAYDPDRYANDAAGISAPETLPENEE